ncbi:MAG: hypothetical protein RI947_707 [Candidatus Parcubacteria bacterium]
MYFASTVSSKENIMNSSNTGILLTDRNDTPFFSFYEAKKRTFIPLADIPEQVQQAVIAAEDKDFYQHPGFSLPAIARALYIDLQTGSLSLGGSTITQQLVKNALLNSNKNIIRKLQEVMLSYEIEKRYSKKEILEMYLNSVYFGEGAFGIENAAQSYFGKHTGDLTLAESAVLVGLLPAPSLYSPLSGDPEKSRTRAVYVLNKMVENGFITPAEKEAALAQDIVYNPISDDINLKAPHFALMVKDLLIEKYGEEQIARSGFKVKTTLDISWQEYAEQVVKTQVNNLARNKVTNGAAVAIDPGNGEVRVLVGSKDWYDNSFGKVNIITAKRQPGSSFKPIVYAAAFEKHIITPGTVLNDTVTTFPGGYKPHNYDNRTRGRVLVRRALSNSLNIPTVEVMSKLGTDNALEMARRLGITTLTNTQDYGLSLALGAGEVTPLELTNAYATFAANGTKHTPIFILEIRDKQNNVIFNAQPASQQVIEPEVAFLISSILSDNNSRQEVFGNALTLSRKAAVKTGTTEDYRDAWTMGYTPQIAVGVWVGNNDNTPMNSIAGSLGAAPIWRQIMERLLRDTPVLTFDPPDGINQLSICRENGLLSKQATSSAFMEYFIAGTEPSGVCGSTAPVQNPTAEPSPGPTAEAEQPTSEPPTETPEPTVTEEPQPTDAQVLPTVQISL